MNKGICGAECEGCGYGKNKNCKGCRGTGGCPFGKPCFIAQYIKMGGMENYVQFKKQLIEEIHGLQIPGLEIHDLFPLNGAYVNLAYPMPDGKMHKFLADDTVYLGSQVECQFGGGEAKRCYGVVCGPDFLLVSEFGENGADPEIILYKRR